MQSSGNCKLSSTVFQVTKCECINRVFKMSPFILYSLCCNYLYTEVNAVIEGLVAEYRKGLLALKD